MRVLLDTHVFVWSCLTPARISESTRHHHRDPLDRLLVAQAQLEDATIATGDPRFLLYDVDVLWAASGEPPKAVHERPKRRRGRRKEASAALQEQKHEVRSHHLHRNVVSGLACTHAHIR